MANVRYQARDFFAYEAITVSSSAIGFTTATHSTSPPGEWALVTVETDQIRWRADGTDPTASEGHLMETGDTIEVYGQNALRAFRAIRVTNDATLRVSYAR